MLDGHLSFFLSALENVRSITMNEDVSASEYLVGLEEAAKIAAGNPCLNCGLFFEIRPIELARASAYAITTETSMGAKINNRRMS